MNYFLIAVKDIVVSRKFYEDLFGLKVKFDFGKNIAFEGGLALQENFAELMGISEDDIKHKTNNFELVFEKDDIDDFILKINEYKGIEYAHPLKEYPWGQRVIRIYDLDKHIIEIGESFVTVIKRFLKNGLSVEETAKMTMHPIEFVKSCVDK